MEFGLGTLKRPMPSEEIIQWRAGFLSALSTLKPTPPNSAEPSGLSPGNRKTGISGTLVSTMFVWNLPSVVTCPGASEWCLYHCYNADSRKSVFSVEDWACNWWWAVNRPDALIRKINSQLIDGVPPVAVRIHSSGDFFSEDYIDLWIRITAENQQVRFWAYTRSWVKPELLTQLNGLRQMENFQLFASWESTMPSPPSAWRYSVVQDNKSYPEMSRFIDDTDIYSCPEQFGKVDNCASCGFCMSENPKSILFTLH